ncbi:MAG: Gfo/Idh/MocA family protein, partial [Actinomycetota bacterium]
MAVCDRNFAADTTLANGVRAFTNYRSLLTVPLDVLVVCMSNDMAAEVTIAGLEHGLHVFCEKPPSRTLEELTAVLATERQHRDLRLMYGFNHRTQPIGPDDCKCILHGSVVSMIEAVHQAEIAMLTFGGQHGGEFFQGARRRLF